MDEGVHFRPLPSRVIPIGVPPERSGAAFTPTPRVRANPGGTHTAKGPGTRPRPVTFEPVVLTPAQAGELVGAAEHDDIGNPSWIVALAWELRARASGSACAGTT